jgi:tRNA 2-thiouridine synthesizing protein D
MRRHTSGSDADRFKGTDLNFSVLVNEGPYQHQASDSAYLFCAAALAKGHEVRRVFFYHDGVNNATKYTEPPQDDRNIVARWSKLADEHKVDLVVCVAAGLRRGLKEDVIAPGFRISGLGQLIDAGIKSERLVVFGD